MKLNVMTWNLGFGSRKKEFIVDDVERADAIIGFLSYLKKSNFKINAIAFQEMANRKYEDGRGFNLQNYFEGYGLNGHFERSLCLGGNHSYPFGKLRELKEKFNIILQEQGPGICVPTAEKWRNEWDLKNLYENGVHQGQSFEKRRIEVSRPLPHPLYMGKKFPPPGQEANRDYTAGRDEEERPVLWSRIGHINSDDTLSNNTGIYFCSIHLPKLKNEETSYQILNDSQKIIAKYILNQSVKGVDELGSKLRTYALKQIIAQTERLAKYWGNTKKCIFILAGDYNFCHGKNLPEESLLKKHGFFCLKKKGSTRPRNKSNNDRLIDNIWVKGAQPEECLLKDKCIEDSTYNDILDRVSDHYPVFGTITIDQ